MSTLNEIKSKLTKLLDKHGLECHPFKVSWYNANVKPGFQLEYHDDTLAFVVISSPSFFEKCFIPFVQQDMGNTLNQDYLDKAISVSLKTAIQSFPDQKVSILHDYDMRPGTRRPKILVQTAGHVSGAVYFYQKTSVIEPPWPHDQAIYGVCIHPKFGGWFALRGVIIFHDIFVTDLQFTPPKDVVEDEAKKIELLNRYNGNWQDWSFRDIIEPVERYSELQKEYFRTPPAERGKLIDSIKSSCM